jgi:hypothetical protein
MDKIPPVSAIDECYEDRHPYGRAIEAMLNPVDSRIQGLVLSQIPMSGPSTLLASATSPSVVIGFIPVMSLPNQFPNKMRKEKKAKKGAKKGVTRSSVPIGLNRCDSYPPLNAIMQLLLFLPALREIFSFAPYSFRSLTDFVETYAIDQDKKVSVSSANLNELYDLFIQKMPAHFFRLDSANIPIKDFLGALIKTVFSQNAAQVGHSPLFDPNSTLFLSSEFDFSSVVDLPNRPVELFVSMKVNKNSGCPIIQRQFFTKVDRSCYDLDAFIEYRADGKDKRGDHIVYLKSEGAWYQCDDDRITPIRSNRLNIALSGSVLLHYKRVIF